MKPVPILSFVFASLLISHAENWPQWRGPTGDGVSRETGLPLVWDDKTNVRWKTKLPGAGNATPVVWGDKIFLAQAAEEERLLMCFARSDGKLLWKRGVKHSEEEITHRTNPKASSSPATDGERVVVSFSSGGVHCFDMNGQPLWKRDLGKQAHIWGYGASPVIIGDLVYLNFGPGERTFLIAMNKQTGKTVWKNDEAGGGFGNKVKGKPGREIWIGSWSTPILRKVKQRDELIMSWPHRVVGLNPLTGEEYWECQGLNPLVYTSPIYADGIVVAMGGYSGSAIAVRAGGKGDVTDTHRLWRHPRTKQRIGSAVIHEGHIYIHNDPGVAECFELKTGERVWEERLGAAGATGKNWSSMVLSDGKLYVNNFSGETFILAASPKFEILRVNSIKEKTIGSMAVSNGELFLRGYEHLWCIGEN